MLADKDIPYVLEQCKDNLHRLNDWEKDFITNISDWWTNKSFLTENQNLTLEKIYQKVP